MDVLLAGIQILTAKSEAEYYEATYLRSISRISQLTDEITLLLNNNAKQQKEIMELKIFKPTYVGDKWVDAGCNDQCKTIFLQTREKKFSSQFSFTNGLFHVSVRKTNSHQSWLCTVNYHLTIYIYISNETFT